jgi:Undecaprenyl-phosphate glucose phosphotransferase
MLTSTDSTHDRTLANGAGTVAARVLTGTKPPVSLVLVAEAMAIGEALIIMLCAIVAKLTYVDQVIASGQPMAPHAQMGIFTAGAAYFVLRSLGLYEPGELVRPTISTPKILLGVLFSFLLLVSVLFLLKVSDSYSRGWMVSWLLLSMAALMAERRFSRHFVAKLVAEGRVRQRVAVYGTEQLLPQALTMLRARCPEVQIVATYPATLGTGVGGAEGSQMCGGLDELIKIGQRNMCDQIVVALPLQHGGVRGAVNRLSVLPVDVVLLPNLDPMPVRVHGYSNLGGLPALKVQAAPLSERQRLAKTAFDIVFSALAMVLLAPVLALVALAIKLDSKGPVCFLQRRHGYNHEVFKVVKFRTMTVLEDGAEVRQATKGDSRVTRVGGFLRKTSIDELPQLWNVLMGDMSLVGPRPHPLSLNERYSAIWPDYANRHRVKPGLTGLAQVNGYRGETTDPKLMRRRALLDLMYIERWSLGLDLAIIVKTVAIVFKRQNAY